MASSVPWKPFTPSKAKTLSQVRLCVITSLAALARSTAAKVLRVDKIYHETPHKIMKLWREVRLKACNRRRRK
jgi:hypothetical protein